jgi:putative addiction module component (TIGR02574 family)
MAFPSAEEIRDLTPEERIRLIDLLWEAFVHDPSVLPVTQAQKLELRRRVTEHEANPASARLTRQSTRLRSTPVSGRSWMARSAGT